MGPDNPWSPTWRPDETGGRIVTIRAARRGALLAGVVYLAVGAAVVALGTQRVETVLAVLAIGLPGVALLGAGLAPSALGSRTEAIMVGVAFAIGAPVAAVTSILIGAIVVSAFVSGEADLAGPILRGSVLGSLTVAPVVAMAATIWVIAIRRSATAARPASSTPPPNPPPTDPASN